MNATNIIKLNQWVIANRKWIEGAQPNRLVMRERAATDCGCKVSDTSLRECLVVNGIATRKINRQKAALQAMKDECVLLTTLVIKILAAAELPEWCIKELRADTTLPLEIRQAVRVSTLKVVSNQS